MSAFTDMIFKRKLDKLEQSLSDSYARSRRGNRAIIFGDSIAAGSDQQSTYSWGGSWFTKLCEASGQKVRIMRNAGVSGNTSTQMLARIQDDVIVYNPDLCILEAITPNDPAQSISVATSKANIIAMLDALKAAGIRTIVCTGPPNDTTARRDQMNQISAWLSQYAASRGLPVWDIYTSIVDPADGTYLAANTGDGTHPNALGQAALVTSLLTRIPSGIDTVPLLSPAKSDTSNLITNGVFIGDSNADGLADNWTLAGTLTEKSISSVSGGSGNWQQITCNGTFAYIEQTISTGWAVGDVLALSGRWSQDTGTSVGAYMAMTGGSYSPRALSSRTDIVSDRTFYIEAPVAPGTTTLKVQLTVNTTAGAARFAQLTLRNLTALGLA